MKNVLKKTGLKMIIGGLLAVGVMCPPPIWVQSCPPPIWQR